jgi:hypothetical protein
MNKLPKESIFGELIQKCFLINSFEILKMLNSLGPSVCQSN